MPHLRVWHLCYYGLMNIEETILNFSDQLSWEPEIKQADKLKKTDKFIVCGMGGSALPAGFLRAHNPQLDLLIHRDYGLPKVPEYFLRESLIIFCSHSGNTEEMIDAFNSASRAGLSVAAVADQGELLELAKQQGVPYIDLPATGIHPRMALGYFLRALTKLMGQELPAAVIKPGDLKSAGALIATRIQNKIPLIYTSAILYPVAYSWKVNFNETAKVPAFVNVLPEADHNEIAANFPNNFYCLMLLDSEMDSRLKNRFEVTQSFFGERGVLGETIELVGDNRWEKLFASYLLGAWTSVTLAQLNNQDPSANPTIEEFKKRIIDSKTKTAS